MHSNCKLLPEDVVCKLTQRNNIRRANTRDPALKLLNEEITSDIQKHKQNIWKEHLDAHWDHRHNTHTLWKTIHGLSNRTPPHTLNTSITFNNKMATTQPHCKLFHQTIHKHATHKTNTLSEQHTTYIHHHHSCRSHATKTAFISSTTLLCLSIHLAVVSNMSTSWYQYPVSSDLS